MIEDFNRKIFRITRYFPLESGDYPLIYSGFRAQADSSPEVVDNAEERELKSVAP